MTDELDDRDVEYVLEFANAQLLVLSDLQTRVADITETVERNSETQAARTDLLEIAIVFLIVAELVLAVARHGPCLRPVAEAAAMASRGRGLPTRCRRQRVRHRHR